MASPAKMESATEPSLMRIYERVVLARIVDEVLVDDQRAGLLPSFFSARGEEAVPIVAALLLETEDGLFPSHRDWPASLARGVSLETLLSQAYGREGDPARGRRPPGYMSSREHRVFSAAGVVGNHLIHAAGFGWAARQRRSSTVAIALFGDGATSSPEFHNALNFAGVFKANVVFVCKNNGFALSHAVENQTRTETIAEKSVAYGIEGLTCDGENIEAVRDALVAAIHRARTGKGPTLIEAVTAPWPTETLGARAGTEDSLIACYPRLRKFLLDRKLLTEERDAALVTGSRAKVRDARERVLARAPAEDSVFRDVLANEATSNGVAERT